MLRMVKGLDSVRFGELLLTLDQDQKRGLDTMPKTMLEALHLINEFKVKAPSSMQKPGGPFKAVFAASVSTKGTPKGKSDKKRNGKPFCGNASNATKRDIGLRSARMRKRRRRSWIIEPRTAETSLL